MYDLHAHPRIVLVLGPTAGGKSNLAIAIAKYFGGQIIGADSMQVYRELDAATAKPSKTQLDEVPHHMVNIVDPSDNWSVADWLEAAENKIHILQKNRSLPIVVGGTNLYLKALLEGMFEGPPADEVFRGANETKDLKELHDQLKQVDPASAERIFLNDRKRIIRALEVYHLTGTPISELQKQWQADRDPTYRHNPILLGLQYTPEQINPRINARVKTMFYPTDGSEGIVDETRRLLAENKLGSQAAEALGTKQVIAHLNGEMSLDEAIEQTKILTRRYAKSQRTWLKRYRGVHWLAPAELGAENTVTRAIEIVQNELQSPES